MAGTARALAASTYVYSEDLDIAAFKFENLLDSSALGEATGTIYAYTRVVEEALAVLAPAFFVRAVHGTADEPLWLDALSLYLAPATVVELVKNLDLVATNGSFNLTLTQRVALRDSLLFAWADILTEIVEAGDNIGLLIEKLCSIAERVGVATTPSSQLEANAAAESILAFTETLSYGIGGDIVDATELRSEAFSRMLASLALLEAAEIGTTATMEGRLTLYANEVATVSDTMYSLGILLSALGDGVVFSTDFGIGGQVYSGWVMNTKNLALSEYDNFPFNSFAKVGTQYYAASETGLYLLDGSTDAGEDIQATITLGAMDFTGERKTNVCEAFLALRNDGEIAIKVKTDDNIERWYRLSQESDVLRDRREKFARGVTSRFWTFSLENINGSDFEIHEITFLPLVMKRRI